MTKWIRAQDVVAALPILMMLLVISVGFLPLNIAFIVMGIAIAYLLAAIIINNIFETKMVYDT